MENIEESLFWREIVLSLCRYYGVDSRLFLNKLNSIKDVWQIRDSGFVLSKIERMEKDRTQFLANEVSSILETLNNAHGLDIK